MKKTSHSKNWLQRLKYYKPLFPRSDKKQSSWRVRSYELNISKSKKIIIKVRSFKTSPNNRSKKFKQYIIKLNHFGAKEIAIALLSKKSKNQKLQKFSKRRLIIHRFSNAAMLISVIGLMFFGLQVSGIGQSKPPVVNAQVETTLNTETVKKSVAKPKFLDKSIPTKINIESINVNANIISVGLTKDGALDTPDIFSNLVGWYQNGPSPGELGPAVLVGHVDTYKGPSVFWELGNLKIGDIITVNREDSSEVKFKVVKTIQYNQNNFGTEEVYGNIDHAGLRVITCGGVFNHITGHYSHNTVIFADIVL